VIDAVDPAPAPSDPTNLLSLIPGPVAAFLAVLLVLMPIISEVKGWTNGPLAKRVSKAAERAEAERVERDDRWQARDRRVEELESAMSTMRTRMNEQQEQLNVLHRQGDAQNRLLANHTDWDRRAQSEVNRLGGNLPAPPPLYVYDEEIA
jgi:hypothetical protein